MTVGTPTIIYPVDADGAVWDAGKAVSVNINDRTVCRPLRELLLTYGRVASMDDMATLLTDKKGTASLDAGFVPLCVLDATILCHEIPRMQTYRACRGLTCDQQYELDAMNTTCPICQMTNTGSAWCVRHIMLLHFPAGGDYEVQFKGSRFSAAVVGEARAKETPAPKRSDIVAAILQRFPLGATISILGWNRTTVKEETESLGDPMMHCTRFWNCRPSDDRAVHGRSLSRQRSGTPNRSQQSFRGRSPSPHRTEDAQREFSPAAHPGDPLQSQDAVDGPTSHVSNATSAEGLNASTSGDIPPNGPAGSEGEVPAGGPAAVV